MAKRKKSLGGGAGPQLDRPPAAPPSESVSADTERFTLGPTTVEGEALDRASLEFRITDAPGGVDVSTDATGGEVLVGVELPFPEHDPGSPIRRHLDAHLDRRQATVLRDLAVALDRRNATLQNGRRVVTKAHALKWLLEAIARSRTQNGG